MKKRNSIIDYLLALLLLAVTGIFLFAGYKLFTVYQEYKVGTDEYTALKEIAITENPASHSNARKKEVEDLPEKIKPPISVDFDALKAINEDVVGWLYVEALDISYPIVQGDNNEQYLHTTYEGTYNFAGSIFIDYENSRNFKDPNTIVYGHNMKNGSMFGSLSKIVSENAYDNSHYFWILTPGHDYRYEIFSAYTTAVNSTTYSLFEKHGKDYGKYLLQMRQNSEIDTGDIQPQKTDNIVTLSTCTGNTAFRFVIQGSQLKA